MSRYIDADALKPDYYDEYVFGDDEYVVRYYSETQIDNAPSIDLADYVPKDFHDKTCEAMAKRHQEEIANMVEVVRCKECRWYDNGQNESDSWNYCTRHFEHYIDVNDDDFCSYGEREGE